MNPLQQNINSLLTSTSAFIAQNEKIKVLKGESFNLFSIMQMESAENKTHSNFIAELLNPKGSHNKGYLFLDSFLNLFCKDHLDIYSTSVKVEHYIGKVIINESDSWCSSGGRIDIFLSDKNGNSISIENKIYAPDQNHQVVRYYNFNTRKNKVLYLTLFGNDPSAESKGELKSGEHFFNISYQKDIGDWLDMCLKESADQPILRESIKQYSILLKKLTNSMDKQFDQDLKRLLISNLEATRHIRDNANRLLDETKSIFRDAVVASLKSLLDAEKFQISKGEAINSTYAQVWIEAKSFIGKPLTFGLESFSGHQNSNLKGNLFIGVINHIPETYTFNLEELNSMSEYWIHYEEIVLNNSNVNLRNEEFLIQIVDEESDRFKLIVDSISAQCKNFILSNLNWVENQNTKNLQE